MKVNSSKLMAWGAVLGAGISAAVVAIGAPVTAPRDHFVYTGYLEVADDEGNSIPASEPVDLTVTFFDSEAGGTPLGTPQSFPGVSPAEGRFSLPVLLPTEARDQGGVWLELGVGSETLSPRQQVLATPYAIEATSAVGALDTRLQSIEGSIVPAGAVLAFDASACPTGWAEYSPAYGRVVRGIDRSGQGVDPDGPRDPGALQADMLASHAHSYVEMYPDNNIDGVDSMTTHSGEHHRRSSFTGAVGGPETRMKNVALLYCKKL